MCAILLIMNWKHLQPTVALALFGVCVGIPVGLAQVIFYEGMELIFAFRHGREFGLFFGLPLVGLLIVHLFKHVDRHNNFGMNLVFLVDQKKEKEIPLAMAPTMIVSTWLAHLCGGSVGREGVAVQVGATISKWIKSKIPVSIPTSTVLMTGVAAGFAGLFGTPVAAVFFALELFCAGTLRLYGLLPAVTASFSSVGVAYLFGMRKNAFVMDIPLGYSWNVLWKIILLGIVCGLVGLMFAKGMHQAKHFYSKFFPNPYVRIFVGGCVAALALMALHQGRYAGLGETLIRQALSDGDVYPYDFLMKMAVTILTLSCGYHGGEVMPLFAIGSTLGAVFGMWMGLPPQICAALGYCAVFGAGTNTYFAPLIISLEAFGFGLFAPMFLVCTLAYLCNFNESIYPLQQVKPFFRR